MHCRGVRGRSKTKSVRFSSDNPSTSLNKPFKDYHASSSIDRNSFGPDHRRSSGSGGETPRAIKCKFYKSIGDESSVTTNLNQDSDDWCTKKDDKKDDRKDDKTDDKVRLKSGC